MTDAQLTTFEPQLIEVHFYDCVTGVYKATLPVSGKKWSSGLNFSFGTFQGTVPLIDPEVRALDPWDVVEEGRTVAVVDVGGKPTEAYMIWQNKRQKSKQGLQLQGQSLLSWFNSRVQATDYSSPPESGISPSVPMTYWSMQPADPTLIAAQLINDALFAYWFDGETTGMDILGGLGILVNGAMPNAGSPVTPTGEWQAPTYPYPNMQSLATLIGQLTQLGYLTGFDINLVPSYTNGPRSSLIGTINIGYPRLGRTYAESGLVIDMDQGSDYDFTGDASKSGSTIYEQGSNGGLFVADNVLPRAQGYPLLEQIASRQLLVGANAAGAQIMLAAAGASDEYMLSYPVYSPTVTQPLWGSDPELGSFEAGDDARVRYSGDFNFPDGMDQEWRIVTWAADAPDEGAASVQFTLNIPPAVPPATGPAITE